MPLLEMRSIVKEFPGVRALDGVSFALESGEFHSLVGENGAGKSTLMKVLSGVYPEGTFDGEILINDEIKHFRGIRDSEDAGIAIIFQELSLVKELTVGENIFLGKEPTRFGVINWTELFHKASELLHDLHLPIDPRVKAGSLGIGQRQLVEIAKALSKDTKILVLDEPTAALTETEVETLFGILKKLRSRGVGLIYISHKLDEVFKMSNRITVLRDGKTVGTHTATETDTDKVIAEMVGREISDIFPPSEHKSGTTALSVKDLTAYSIDTANKKVLDNVSFNVKKGEVLGIAGLMGAGRSELLMTIFGAWQGKYSKEIEIDGKLAVINSPADAIANGIGFVTEDRKRFGLILDQTIADNMTLAGLRSISGRFLTDRTRETIAVKKPMTSLRIKAKSPMIVTGTLSGGNQQKVVLGKWLLTKPKVLFLDEPTRGIDVGTKQEIYAEINKLASSGIAIVLVSSELPEVLGLSDRVIVLHQGKLTAEFTRREATPKKLWRRRPVTANQMEEANTSGITKSTLRAYIMIAIVALIWVYFHLATDSIFLTPRNLSNLMTQMSVTAILAVGMLMVIVSGNIDLSVGSLLGFAGGIAAYALTVLEYGLPASIVVAIGIGVAVGAFHGLLIAYLNIPAFIVTLGGLLAWRGAVKWLLGGNTIPVSDETFRAIGNANLPETTGWALAAIGGGAVLFMAYRKALSVKKYGLGEPDYLKELLRAIVPVAAVVVFIIVMNTERGSALQQESGVPVPVLILVAVALLGAFLTNSTVFGRYIYAIGGNPEAARLSGINNKRNILKVYALLGALTGIAALIFTSRVNSAAPDAGVLKELDAIAACVIGGASLMGGRGTIFGACLGALIMASLDNGMSLLNVRDFMQDIIKGSILVAAVGLDMMGRRTA